MLQFGIKKKSAQNVMVVFKKSDKSKVLGNLAQKKEFVVKEITSNDKAIDIKGEKKYDSRRTSIEF